MPIPANFLTPPIYDLFVRTVPIIKHTKLQKSSTEKSAVHQAVRWKVCGLRAQKKGYIYF